jgi:hypothetical protein
MKEIVFEFKEIKYKAKYKIIRMPKEDHYFIFPEEKEIIDIVGQSFPMYINNLPESNFNWKDSTHPLAEEVKLAIAKVMRETI